MRWLLAVLWSGVAVALSGDSAITDSIMLDLGEGKSRAVLLVAGGYRGDWCPEAAADVGTGAVENAIHLVDAATGATIWTVTGAGTASTPAAGGLVSRQPLMMHSIVAPITPADSDGNGMVDRAYVADTGGVLWRLTFPEPGAGYTGGIDNILASYTAEPLALLGGEGVPTRQFFHQVDYVRSRDQAGDYDGVFLVSGKRGATTAAGGQNYAYLVKDRAGLPVHHEQLPDITLACAQRDSADCREVNFHRGWKLALQGTGETGVSRPLISRGVVYFSTYLPPEGEDASCDQALGEGLVYAVNLADGSPGKLRAADADAQAPVGSGPERYLRVGPGVPGAITPWRDQVRLPGAGETGARAIEAGGAFRWRIYWREEGVDVQ